MELTLRGDLLTITVTAEDGEVCSASVTSRMGVNTVPGGGGCWDELRTEKANLFLIELVCNLLIFALCAAVCVGLLVHARRISSGEHASHPGGLSRPIHRRGVEGHRGGARAAQEEDNGFSAQCAVRGNELDIAIYQDDIQVYELEGVTYLG